MSCEKKRYEVRKHEMDETKINNLRYDKKWEKLKWD